MTKGPQQTKALLPGGVCQVLRDPFPGVEGKEQTPWVRLIFYYTIPKYDFFNFDYPKHSLADSKSLWVWKNYFLWKVINILANLDYFPLSFSFGNQCEAVDIFGNSLLTKTTTIIGFVLKHSRFASHLELAGLIVRWVPWDPQVKGSLWVNIVWTLQNGT